MKYNIIGVNLTNVDTGEILIQDVSEYDFSMPLHIEAMYKLVDAFIRVVRDNCIGDHHYTYDLDFRSYRSHRQLEIPF